jgi:hypothetical protein
MAGLGHDCPLSGARLSGGLAKPARRRWPPYLAGSSPTNLAAAFTARAIDFPDSRSPRRRPGGIDIGSDELAAGSDLAEQGAA